MSRSPSRFLVLGSGRTAAVGEGLWPTPLIGLLPVQSRRRMTMQARVGHAHRMVARARGKRGHALSWCAGRN